MAADINLLNSIEQRVKEALEPLATSCHLKFLDVVSGEDWGTIEREEQMRSPGLGVYVERYGPVALDNMGGAWGLDVTLGILTFESNARGGNARLRGGAGLAGLRATHLEVFRKLQGILLAGLSGVKGAFPVQVGAASIQEVAPDAFRWVIPVTVKTLPDTFGDA